MSGLHRTVEAGEDGRRLDRTALQHSRALLLQRAREDVVTLEGDELVGVRLLGPLAEGEDE